MAADAAMDGITMTAAAAKAGRAEGAEEGNLREGALREESPNEEKLRGEYLTEGRMNVAVRKKDILIMIVVVKIMKENVKKRVVMYQE